MTGNEKKHFSDEWWKLFYVSYIYQTYSYHRSNHFKYILNQNTSQVNIMYIAQYVKKKKNSSRGFTICTV